MARDKGTQEEEEVVWGKELTSKNESDLTMQKKNNHGFVRGDWRMIKARGEYLGKALITSRQFHASGNAMRRSTNLKF